MSGWRFFLGACAFFLTAGAASTAAPGGEGPDLARILADAPAQTLAAYRLFRDTDARSPNAGVTAYDVPTPLFSDYASKRRYIYLPPGGRARYRAEGAFDFPVGTVLIKTFEYPADLRRPELNVRRIETRLLIHHASGWVANTYVWNAQGTQARLQVAGGQLPIRFIQPNGGAREILYDVPNRNQCKGCHSLDGAIAPIGPSATHLNEGSGSGEETELARWSRLGLLDGAPYSGALAPRSIEARARAYLDINCAHCHNPHGAANTSGLDLRAAQSEPARWGLRKRPVAAGRGSADLTYAIDPGRPERSILLHRIESEDPGVMMPELGRTVVHAEGVELVRTWIAQMDADGRPRQN